MMLELKEQYFVVNFLSLQLSKMINRNLHRLATDERFDDLVGVRQLMDNLYHLHARAENPKAFHFSAEDAREALTAYHARLRDQIHSEFREAAVKQFENTMLIDKIFG
jgi:hypothetical protein